MKVFKVWEHLSEYVIKQFWDVADQLKGQSGEHNILHYMFEKIF